MKKDYIEPVIVVIEVSNEDVIMNSVEVDFDELT